MKKIYLLAFGFVMMAKLTQAATTGNLLIKGTVPALLSIAITPEPLASTLPLDTTQTDSKVATIQELSNSNSGYQVAITSSNLGKLVHESVGTSFINYSVKYDGNSVDLANGQTFSYPAAAAVANNRDVEISYTGIDHQSLIEGDYADTVTFTISAN
jgi:hypothetical protein